MTVFYIMITLFWVCIGVMIICQAIKREIEINREFQRMYDEAMEGLRK